MARPHLSGAYNPLAVVTFESGGAAMGNGGEPLSEERLAGLARYFDEEVMSAKNYKTS